SLSSGLSPSLIGDTGSTWSNTVRATCNRRRDAGFIPLQRDKCPKLRTILKSFSRRESKRRECRPPTVVRISGYAPVTRREIFFLIWLRLLTLRGADGSEAIQHTVAFGAGIHAARPGRKSRGHVLLRPHRLRFRPHRQLAHVRLWRSRAALP